MYGIYYSLDCAKCNECKLDESLFYKSWKLLKEYEIIPCNSKFKNKVKLEDIDIVNIHRKLVDNYNNCVRKFKEADINKSKYKEIKYTH